MTKITEFQGEYRFLSNFWPAKVILDGDEYPSVENAYVAAKTNNFKLREPLKTLSAGQAKRLGRSFQLRPDWDLVKLEIMYDLVKQKFSHEHLKMSLLRTGDSVLEEGNTWGDTYWGVCRGKGSNHLGEILMAVRTRLKEVTT